MKKIMVVVTNRAPYGRLKSVLKAINDHPSLELQLVVGGSALLDKYGSCVKQIESDGFEVIEKIDCIVECDSPKGMVKTTALLSLALAETMDRLKPDIVLVHADRYEQLAVAQAAAYMNITVAHTQGGEVTGSIDDKVRNTITQLADIHFPATKCSMMRITARLDGCKWYSVFPVGCPSIDLIKDLDMSITEDFNIKYPATGCNIDFKGDYIVVMQHPVTTEYGDGAKQIKETIKAVKMINKPTVWLWSNVDAGTDDISAEIRKSRERGELDHVRFVKNFSPEDFYRCIYNASIFIGNSSSGIREGSYLGVNYICIGTRQESREHGENVEFCDYDSGSIYRAFRTFINYDNIPIRNSPKSDRFGTGTTGKEIAKILGG